MQKMQHGSTCSTDLLGFLYSYLDLGKASVGILFTYHRKNETYFTMGISILEYPK